MLPTNPLPYNGPFSSPDEYITALLNFATTEDIFQILCGGVHILDFFTTEPGLFHAAIPTEWQAFLLSLDSMRLLDLLMRDDLDALDFEPGQGPPESLLRYIRSIRDLSLRRDFSPPERALPVLPRPVAVGMKPKKIHEVRHFADYIHRLARDVSGSREISHVVDFGSGQNYLGRALASEPYNRRVVAVEGRENNVAAARYLDSLSGLAAKTKVKRNKKLWTRILQIVGPDKQDDAEAIAEAIRQVAGAEGFDFRPAHELEVRTEPAAGGGHVEYVSGRLDSGDLGDILGKVQGQGLSDEQRQTSVAQDEVHQQPRSIKNGAPEDAAPQFMAVSIHSCGNLSHHSIRSLLLNPSIRAIAMVGCCYNLMTEKLGPPTYKHAYLRPTLQALNGRVASESAKNDPHGFPMSRRFSTHGGEGIRLNITARMMACQAPQNWGREDSEAFFTRHFYRAVLQRIFLDRGVVGRIRHGDGARPSASGDDDAFEVSTEPVILGSLSKHCHSSLRAYVRGAIKKLSQNTDEHQHQHPSSSTAAAAAATISAKMANMTDEEIDAYEAAYGARRRELCIVWSLMAFSATAVESLIVSDRWTYLVEQGPVVERAWVETVFEYAQSPRNLVVVGVKRDDV